LAQKLRVEGMRAKGLAMADHIFWNGNKPLHLLLSCGRRCRRRIQRHLWQPKVES